MKVTQNDLDKVMEANISLSRYGFEDNKEREEIDIEEFSKCVSWMKENLLSSNKFTCDSYQIKHFVEQFMGGYIPNGATIAAAEFLNIPIKKDGKNARFKAKIKETQTRF
jgi:hypothetical protein